MLLSIIIVSYNTQELTLQAVTSCVGDLKQSPKLVHKTEVIVVDNHSSDGTVAQVKRFLNSQPIAFRVIENQENLGFAQANNQGIGQSSGDYILLLNSDTVVQPGSLDALVAAFETAPVRDATANLASHRGELDRLGILSAQLRNLDGTIQAQGGNFPTLSSLTVHMLMLDDLPWVGNWFPSTQYTGKNTHSSPQSESQIQLQPWVSGAAMMIRRNLIEEIGPLDGNIFMYAEDVEFCLRAANHHWDVGILPAAPILHVGSASSSSANAIKGELKGYLYVWAKHRPQWQLPLVKTILKLGCLVRVLVFGTIVGDKAKAQVYSSVVRDL